MLGDYIKKLFLIVIFFFLLFIPLNLFGQQLFREIGQVTKSNSEMVVPFSIQAPMDVYQSHQVHRRFNVVGRKRSGYVCTPNTSRIEILNGLEFYNHSYGEFNVVPNEYYTKTPKCIDVVNVATTACNKYPMIKIKDRSMNFLEEEAVIITGPTQRLPGNWGDPERPTPVGDFLLPMLFFVGIYIFLRVIKEFKN